MHDREPLNVQCVMSKGKYKDQAISGEAIFWVRTFQTTEYFVLLVHCTLYGYISVAICHEPGVTSWQFPLVVTVVSIVHPTS